MSEVFCGFAQTPLIMGDIKKLLGIAALLLSVSIPCAPSYNIAEPAAAIQEFTPAGAVENALSVNDQTDVVLYEETTVESEGDEGETDSLDIQYLLFLRFPQQHQ